MSDFNFESVYNNSGDSLGSFLEPDIMLPSQLLCPEEEGLDAGERKLMAAILSDGIEAYIHQSLNSETQKSRVRQEIIDWVENEDTEYIFSFDNVSESLGINPQYLRLGLYRYVATAKKNKETNTATDSWKKIRRPRKH